MFTEQINDDDDDDDEVNYFMSQVIVIVSDGDHGNDEDPVNERDLLMSRDVNIFAVGIGSWLKVAIIRQWATKPDYYGGTKDWENMMKTFLTNVGPGNVDAKYQRP